MIDYREQLASVLRAVAVISPTSFAWFGTESQPLPPAVVAALPPTTSRRYLVDALQHELYRSFYVQGRPVPAQRGRGVPQRSDLAFVRSLSIANTGEGGWEPGWRVAQVERGSAVVERDGLSVRAQISDCRAAGRHLTSGAPISLRRPKELSARSPGFYIAIGDAAGVVSREDIEVRVYFNVSAAGAAPLVAICTRLLNGAHIPFSLKVLDHPIGFSRCDAAVLYLDSDAFERARRFLSAIASACALHLRGMPPAFARPLAPGMSVGEHRAGLGPSFGSSRCRLVAEGIVAAHERGAGRLRDRVDAVAHQFAAHGLDIDAPYMATRSGGRCAL